MYHYRTAYLREIIVPSSAAFFFVTRFFPLFSVSLLVEKKTRVYVYVPECSRKDFASLAIEIFLNRNAIKTINCKII